MEGEISVKSFFTLSFSFSLNEHEDTDKRRAQDSGFLIMRENIVKFNSMMNKY